jgi:VanZ family protein
MDWNKFINSYKQIKNCLLHITLGLLLIFIIFTLTQSIYTLFMGLILGLIVEIYQYYFLDNKELKIEDRLADISQWLIGGLLAYPLHLILSYV